MAGQANIAATGRGFMPGESGNPGGRPRSMAEAVLARRSKASTYIVDFWVLVAFVPATAVLLSGFESPFVVLTLNGPAVDR
jgi:hypothetical protein